MSRILYKMRFHCRVLNISPLVPVLSQMKPVCTICSYVSKFHICAHIYLIYFLQLILQEMHAFLLSLWLESSCQISKCLFVQPLLEWLMLTFILKLKNAFFVKFKSRQTNVMTFVVFRRSSTICYYARTNSSPLSPGNFSDIPVGRVIRPLNRRRNFIRIYGSCA